MVDSHWPKVSIVTPSYNQAQFLEETILSVLNQDYPTVEYIIIDGGSTDGSVDIIRKYQDRIAYWVSEKDTGQAKAINKGWQHSTGDIIAWLNSDDLYMPGAVQAAVNALRGNPAAGMVYSDGLLIDGEGNVQDVLPSRLRFDVVHLLRDGQGFPQPTVFLRRRVLDTIGYLNTNFHYCMDYEFYVRVAFKWPAVRIPDQHLAKFRIHNTSKTSMHFLDFYIEAERVFDLVFGSDNVPAEVWAIRRQVYGALYFDLATGWVQRRQWSLALGYLAKAIATRPGYVAMRPRRLAGILRRACAGYLVPLTSRG